MGRVLISLTRGTQQFNIIQKKGGCVKHYSFTNFTNDPCQFCAMVLKKNKYTIKRAVFTALLLFFIFKCEAMGTDFEIKKIASESIALDLEIADPDFGDITRC